MKLARALLIAFAAAVPGFSHVRPRQRFPRPHHPSDRALPARRPERHHRARGRAEDVRTSSSRPIVIDNSGGQGGVLGTDFVAKAAPDGYTIGIVSAGALAISASMEKVAYDTLKDLAADHAGRQSAGNAGGGDQRPRQQHERAGRAGQGETRQAQLRLDRPRQHAASGRRVVQAHRQNRHRARALSAARRRR